MNEFFSDRGLQALAVIVFFILAYLIIFWATGRLKENYIDRCRVLAFKIMKAKEVEILLTLEDELDKMYEDFYDKDPENVTAARIYLAARLDMRIKELTGYDVFLKGFS